jgi:hypothetical protein
MAKKSVAAEPVRDESGRRVLTAAQFVNLLLQGTLPLTRDERQTLERGIAAFIDRDSDMCEVLAKYNVKFDEHGRAL